MPTEKEQNDKLLQLIRDAVQQDQTLRETYKIGDKFRFIRDRLTALLSKVEESVTVLQKKTEQKVETIAEDETSVYVYLYNAHGITVPTWKKMLGADVFYEYSVNRPIYGEKAHIESFIRSRQNKVQHGYLTVIIKKQNILATATEAKDAIGLPLVKVKEGALELKRLAAFTHNDIEYILDEEGELIKKTTPNAT